MSAYLRRYRKDDQDRAVEHYGGKCACCGETERAFLVIDHIHGGGNEHRKQEKITGANNIGAWLKKHGYPEGFQVLCANCNTAKEKEGGCPHAQK